MSFCPHIFDSEAVQARVREQISQIYSYAAVSCGLVLGLLYILTLPEVNTLLVAAITATASWGAYRYLFARINRLRNVVWCVKLTEHDVVGYDHSRTRLSIPWEDIDRINLTDGGIQIQTLASRSIEVPHLFDDYHEISHLLMEEAEYRGIPLFINGYPWQQATVYQLFPELGEAGLKQTG